uniref:Secreted protein n=1 Tax=Panagrellus redivivus TaxID=6233 RepID=A0A7E4VGR8_PANRE
MPLNEDDHSVANVMCLHVPLLLLLVQQALGGAVKWGLKILEFNTYEQIDGCGSRIRVRSKQCQEEGTSCKWHGVLNCAMVDRHRCARLDLLTSRVAIGFVTRSGRAVRETGELPCLGHLRHRVKKCFLGVLLHLCRKTSI